MQSFKKAVFSALSNFLALASLRQAVRLACFAAASLAAAVEADAAVEAGVVVETGVSVEGVGVWGVAC
jgi:hypothetical protein